MIYTINKKLILEAKEPFTITETNPNPMGGIAWNKLEREKYKKRRTPADRLKNNINKIGDK